MPTASQLDVYEEIGNALGRLFRGPDANPPVRKRLEELTGRPYDRSAFMLVGRIARDEPLRLSDLAQRCGLDASTVSRRIAELERDGLVARETDVDDGRASVLRLTADGRQLLERLTRARKVLLAEVLADWPERDRRDLARLLARLTDALAVHWSAS